MTGQTLTPELKAWLQTQKRAGVAREVAVRAMTDAGWLPSVALAAWQGDEPSVEQEAFSWPERPNPMQGKWPRVALAGSPRVLQLGDQTVQVLVSLKEPHLVVLGGFLSDAECDWLMAHAAPRMQRSLTVEISSGGQAVNDDRTSSGMFFARGEADMLTRIEARIERLLNWPVSHGEGLQVLHYRPGAEYKPHFDYFDPKAPGTASILARGGQRVGTLLMYLNEPELGGGTVFPDLGLEVLPQRGHAVFFAYDRPHPDTQTLHGGAPVLAGEKWVATKWLRERPFA